MSHSQNNEEQIILEFFGDKADGHLLEIGAFDGATFSNTLALIERGWSGVCVEPSPGPLLGLLKRHGDNPKVKIVQAAITAEQESPTVFYDSGGDAISTFSHLHRARWESSGSKFKPFHVFPVTVDQLFDTFGYDFDFISLDVEGTNWALFNALPFAQLKKLRLICVEYDLHSARMLELIEPYGFKQIAVNGENLILGRSIG